MVVEYVMSYLGVIINKNYMYALAYIFEKVD